MRFENQPPAKARSWRVRLCRTVGGLRNLVDVGDVLGSVERRTEDAAVPANHQQDVVEIVCNAACELTDRFEPLGLLETLLERTPRGHIAGRNNHAMDGRILEQIEPDRLHQTPAPVLMTCTELLRLDEAGIVELAGEETIDHRSVLGMNEVERRRTREIFREVPEDARHRRTDVLHAHVGVEDCGDVDRVFNQRPEARLARLERRNELRRTLRNAALDLQL